MLALILLTLTLSANAFWNNNSWNNMPWDNNNSNYGYQNDNGIFGYNPYNFWNPRWYAEEINNIVDEFDDNNWGNNNYGYNPYNYRNPYNHRRGNGNGYNFAPNHYMNTPWGAGVTPEANAPATDK